LSLFEGRLARNVVSAAYREAHDRALKQLERATPILSKGRAHWLDGSVKDTIVCLVG
jgi:hypothetical protein